MQRATYMSMFDIMVMIFAGIHNGTNRNKGVTIHFLKKGKTTELSYTLYWYIGIILHIKFIMTKKFHKDTYIYLILCKKKFLLSNIQ